MTDASLTHTHVIASSDGNEDVPPHRYAREALERNKREGMALAMRARLGALSVTGVLLIYLNPAWSMLWYHGLLVCLILLGLAQHRVARVGRSRAELALLFADLSLMTAALLVPNPFDSTEAPTAMVFQFGVFQYFYILLASAILCYSWRTILAIGTWTSVLWMIGSALIWWFGTTYDHMTQAAQLMFPDIPQLANAMDPNTVDWDRRVQQVIVFFIVSVILALAVRRYQALVLESADMARERTNLARYFSPSMVSELSTKDEPLGQIRSHDAAVLFVDIAGFTAYADSRPATEVIETLRAFHARMEAEVFAHEGTLDKYLGDGLMATFGTPLPSSTDAARAVDCVRGMVRRMEALNAERRVDGLPEIDARFGLHYGPVVLGDIGANRLEFAVLGDTVNIASRLEGLTRQRKVRAMLSDAAVQAAGSSTGLTQLGPQSVRGVTEQLNVWGIE